MKNDLLLLKKLNPVIPGRVSDDLYDRSIGVLNKDPMAYSQGYKMRIIHMIDAVSRGYISPMEAYDAIARDYFPVQLELRDSLYAHLLKRD